MAVLKFIAGCVLICASFALLGLCFQFIDAVRNEWPIWAVFATMPIWVVAIMAAFLFGTGMFALMVKDEPE